MGTPPAPPYTTIYYSIPEKIVCTMVQRMPPVLQTIHRQRYWNLDPTPRLPPECPRMVPLPKDDEFIPWSHMGIQHPFQDSGLHGHEHKNNIYQ